MNNKQLGMQFEKEVCLYLSNDGYWVHFITPDKRGSQPFDIIAVKNGKPIAIDCKTSASHIFPLSRLEDNQIYAFEKWMKCGNGVPLVYIKYENKLYVVRYTDLKEKGKVLLYDYQGIELYNYI